MISESRFLGWLQNPIADAAPPVDKEKEAKLLAGVAGRAQRVRSF